MAKVVDKKLPKSDRNFWIQGVVDGQAVELKGGPATRDGGFHLNLFMRDRGSLKRVCEIIAKYDRLTGECVLEIDQVQDYESGGVSRVNAHQIVTQRDLEII